MNYTIHRSEHGICGASVELASGDSRVFLDPCGVIQGVKGLYKDGPRGVDAVFMSRMDPDHSSALNLLHPEIPVYLSAPANALLGVSNIFSGNKRCGSKPEVIKNRKIIKTGDFYCMPYPVDPLAPDGLAFLFESRGKRLFYLGDMRGIGRKKALFELVKKDPPDNIGVLLAGGSGHFVPGDGLDRTPAAARISGMINAGKAVTFFLSMLYDVEAMCAAYNACHRTGSVFIIDLYAAFVLGMLRKFSDRLPQYDRTDVRIRFLPGQKERLVEGGYAPLVYEYGKRSIDIFEINRMKNKILMLARDDGTLPEMAKKVEASAGAVVIDGVGREFLSDRLKEYCKKKDMTIEDPRSGDGHLKEALDEFYKALRPGRIVSPDDKAEVAGAVA